MLPAEGDRELLPSGNRELGAPGLYLACRYMSCIARSQPGSASTHATAKIAASVDAGTARACERIMTAPSRHAWRAAREAPAAQPRARTEDRPPERPEAAHCGSPW